MAYKNNRRDDEGVGVAHKNNCRDNEGVDMVHKNNTTQKPFTDDNKAGLQGKTKPKQAFRFTRKDFKKLLWNFLAYCSIRI